MIGKDMVVDLAGKDSHPAAVVRSLVVEGIGLNSHLAAVRSLAGEDIGLVAVAGHKEPAGHRELVGHMELVGHKVVGGAGPDFRNSRYLT